MQEVFRAIGRLSQSHVTVLINGESGTGKELVARALHRHSPRADKPFIALNTAAIPKDLLESELFGHERGAFTGAQAMRRGRFEQADGGTLFLDEIGDMPAELQTRLLRVLSDGQFYRVGGHPPIKVNVRVIAATHQDLEQRVKQGLFREDLFHRLNVIRLRLPPLRERREDIPLLAKSFPAEKRAGTGRGGQKSCPMPRSSTWPLCRGAATCANWKTSATGSPSWRPARTWRWSIYLRNCARKAKLRRQSTGPVHWNRCQRRLRSRRERHHGSTHSPVRTRADLPGTQAHWRTKN